MNKKGKKSAKRYECKLRKARSQWQDLGHARRYLAVKRLYRDMVRFSVECSASYVDLGWRGAECAD